MISVSVKYDLDQAIRLLDDKIRKQVPFATAKALTRTAQISKDNVIAEMQKVFDRPTPYTLKSLYIKPATKQNLQAMVYLKNTMLGGKNNYSLAEILGHEFAGGTRIRKRIESAFTRAGLISSTEYLVPGAGAKLDKYGNMSKGQIVQIMSQIKVGADAAAYASNSSRSKKNVKLAGVMFWSRGGSLPRGVWMRSGTSVIPIMLVIQQPKYKQRINMDAIIKKTIKAVFNQEFDAALKDAVRSAR